MSKAFFSSRRFIRSYATLPEQAITRLTLAGSMSGWFGPITVRNSPLVNSDNGADASLFRSSDLGVMMTSGFLNMRTICRRKT